MKLPQPTLQQKEAIETVDGPVLIIAGAGTGKTFTLTQRILHIINSNLGSTEDILALTFTEKAAYEMQERVEMHLPLGFGQTNISTFHSFCDEFLRQEAINIGMSPGYKIMTTTDEVFFIKKHLFEFELDILRPKGNPSKFIYEIVKHISRLQDENITPQAYRNYYDANKDNLSEEEKKKLDELVSFYEKYSKIKIENDLISFGDLITRTYNILLEREAIKKRWLNRFKYIMIDEFQDTNYAQYELVKLLAGSTNSEKPANIMVVADDDQSIYKFRGAAVSNVLQFVKDFPQCKRIVLTENRRSAQEILDLSHKMIQFNNPDRLEVREKIDKKLSQHAQDLIEFPNPLEFRHYLSGNDEIEGLALEIKDLVNEKSVGDDLQLSLTSKNNIKYNDIAVLVRSHSLSDEVTVALKRHGIPFQFSGARKLFNREEVKHLLNFLRVIVDYKDSISMNGLLDMDLWNLSDREIVDINIASRTQKKSVFEIIEDSQKLSSIVELIKSAWGENRNGLGTWQILYNFVNKSGFIASMSESDDEELGTREFGSETNEPVVKDISLEFENTLKLKNISRFFEFIMTFEKNNLESDVYQFVDYIDLLLESGDSPMVENTEYEERDAVHIITVHSSKGLEFPVVFVPSCVRGRFPSKNRGDVLPIPEELIKEVLPQGDEHMQEERRLMYVAITRAKSKVYLSSAEFYGEGKRKTKISPFIVELFGEQEILSKINSPITFDLKSSIIEAIEKEESNIKGLSKIKSLSYSQVSDYVTCPRKYKYKYIFKIPSKPSPALSYGITMHNTLNEFYKLLKYSKESLFDSTSEINEERLLEIFQQKWISTGYINEEHEARAKKTAVDTLQKFFKTYFDIKQNPVFLEQSFNLKFGEVTLKGKIDRIDQNDDKTYEIIDYKTGDKVRSQSEVNKDMQLAIYALAAEKVFGISSSNLSLLFLDKGVKVSADNAKIEQLKSEVISQISEVSRKIAKEIFTATPGFHCKYCDYRNICKFAKE